MAVRIDERGLYIPGSDLVDYEEEDTEEIITTPVPDGFWWPRWGGTVWVEGLSEEEIKQRIGTKIADWQNLTATMRGTMPFIKLFSIAQEFSERGAIANAVFTLLMATLTASHNKADLEFTVLALPSIMQGVYNNADIDIINVALDTNGFTIVLPSY